MLEQISIIVKRLSEDLDLIVGTSVVALIIFYVIKLLIDDLIVGALKRVGKPMFKLLFRFLNWVKEHPAFIPICLPSLVIIVLSAIAFFDTSTPQAIDTISTEQPIETLPPTVMKTPTIPPTTSPIPTPTPTFDISQASGNLDVATFVAIYFDRINSAVKQQDLQWGWKHLSSNFNSYNDIKAYADEWLPYSIKYQIWKCSETEVDISLRYFGKADINYRVEKDSFWVRYVLSIDENNEWVFDSGTKFGQQPIKLVSECKLEASNYLEVK